MMKEINFNNYVEIIKKHLYEKSHNSDCKAIMTIADIDIRIKPTTDLTYELIEWLKKQEFVCDVVFIGKGKVECKISEKFLENELQKRL